MKKKLKIFLYVITFSLIFLCIYIYSVDNNNILNAFVFWGGKADLIYEKSGIKKEVQEKKEEENRKGPVYGFTFNSELWYLAPPLAIADISNRGRLYYRDYARYSYKTHSFKEWLCFREVDFLDSSFYRPGNIADYHKKPGPYNADAYRSIIDKKILVLDYDFEGKANGWISIIRSDAYPGNGCDYSRFTNLCMGIKYVNSKYDYIDTNAKIKLSVYIGVFTEDLDGDFILDEEYDVYDHGFDFDGNNGIIHIGGGPGVDFIGEIGVTYYSHNYRRDTEDLDHNGKFLLIQTNYFLELPNINYAPITSGSTYLSMNFSREYTDVNWTEVNISIKQDNMTSHQKEILKHIKNMIIKVDYISGISRGRVLIRDFYFE